MRALYVATITLFGCIIQVTGFAQGTAIIDVQLPEPDKYDLEKIMSSPGESDTKFVYKPATDPDPGVISKDTLTAHSSTNNTTHHAASNVTRVRMEKTAPPATKETVQKQSKNQEESPKAKTDDDSIMSFNFLYYIIEKYKLQDIVD